MQLCFLDSRSHMTLVNSKCPNQPEWECSSYPGPGWWAGRWPGCCRPRSQPHTDKNLRQTSPIPAPANHADSWRDTEKTFIIITLDVWETGSWLSERNLDVKVKVMQLIMIMTQKAQMLWQGRSWIQANQVNITPAVWAYMYCGNKKNPVQTFCTKQRNPNPNADIHLSRKPDYWDSLSFSIFSHTTILK